MTPSPAERLHQILDLERQARFAREAELKEEISLLRIQLITLDHQLMAVAKGDRLHEDAHPTLHIIAEELERLQRARDEAHQSALDWKAEWEQAQDRITQLGGRDE